MKKTLNKVVAVVLTLAMLLSIASVPISADTLNSLANDNTNGITIDLTGIISSDNKGANPIKSAKANDTFYMIINFDGNPADETGIIAYNILFGYNSEKIEITKVMGGLATPLVENATYNNGVALYSWATTAETIMNEDSEPQSSGRLFRLQLKALTDLEEDDLAKFKPIKSATSSSGATTETSLNDLNKKAFTLNWISELKESEEPTYTEITDADFSFDLAEKEYTGSAIEPAVTPLTGLTVDVDYKVEYSNNVNAGTATITVQGIGKYTGTVTKTFTIKAKQDSGDNTNGITIDLTGIISSDNKGSNPIKSAKANDTFYMIINFDGNPADETGIIAYNILFGYNSEKIEIIKVMGGLATPLVENAAYNDGVALYSWATTAETIMNEDSEPQSSGRLFRLQLKALTDLEEDDLAKFKPIKSATSSSGATTETSLNDLNKKAFTLNWISELKETAEATEIKESDFDLSKIKDTEYTGTAIKPTVTSKTGLVEKTDYEVVYGENTSVAKGGTVTINGIGNYKGTINKTFAITAKAIEETDFDLSKIADSEYTGTAIKPAVTSKTGLVEKTDYEVVYGENTSVAKGGTVTINGIGNYKGTINKTFAITAKDINDLVDTFTFDLADKEHDGSAIEPKVTSTKLTEDTDFEVTYANNVEIGDATITVKGIGNYTGTITETFKIIDPSTLDDIKLSIAFTKADSEGYGDKDKITSVEKGDKFWMWINFSNNPTELDKTAVAYGMLVSYDEDKIQIEKSHGWLIAPTFNSDFNKGIAYANWAGLSGIVSSATIPPQIQSEGTLFVIEATAKDTLSARDLRDITIPKEAWGHTDIEATEPNKTHFRNSNGNFIDYVVEYTIGAIPEIEEDDFIIDTSEKEYKGYEIRPSVSSEKLTEGKDYLVDYADNLNAGRATITIKGIGEYAGMVQETFTIKPKGIVESNFKFNLESKTYTGSAIKPTVTSSALVEGTEYEVSYDNNVNVGRAIIFVNGKGNYTGTVITYFEITARTITDADFVFDLKDKEYEGKEIKPDVVGNKLDVADYTVTYDNNIEVGNATLVVVGRGNYTGTLKKNFKIVPKAIKEIDFDFDLKNREYKGEEIKPEITSETLEAGKDYDVEYANNVNVGKATITITGKGNYEDTVYLTFFIDPKPIIADDFAFDLDEKKEKTYTGEEIKPEVTSEKLVAGTDFEVTYANNVNVSTDSTKAKIIVKGKGNYTGTVTNEFAIIPRQISAADFEFDRVNQVYTGSAIEPEVKSTLVAGVDYEVTYEDNINVGPATIIVTGKGNNCAGKVTQKFAIVAKTITADDFDFELDPEVYIGSAITPEVTAKEETGLVADVDYEVTYENNVNVGTATIIVVGKENYAGRVEKEFDITQRTLIDDDFNLKDVPVKYTGSEITPEVRSALKAGEDYEVTYTDNVNAGTAKVTITAIGDNCVGTITKEFEITPITVTADDFIIDNANQLFTGSEITPEVTAITGLKEGTDYEVVYGENIDGTGTITVTIVGNNCTGDPIEATFKILNNDINDVGFDFSAIEDAEYTGSEITPDVSVEGLEEGVDYVVTYLNNTNVGKATVIIESFGDTYGGKIEKHFEITAKELTDADFTINPDTYEYTGKEYILGDGVGVETSLKIADYDVAYDNNVDVSTEDKKATVIFTGKGNYKGEVRKTFTITPKTITADDFKPIGNKVYTGSEIKPVKAKTEGLVEGTDFDVVYNPGNVDAGSVTATITGKGNCTGTFDMTFTITVKTITDADFTFDLADKVYTGSKIEPAVASTLPTADYTVTYENNVEVGKATITVEGNDPNCFGQIKKEFTIVPKTAPEVNGPSGGGGGSSAYVITVPEIAGGKVTSSHTKARAGQTVTITVTPDEGYVLSAVKVVDKSGKEIAVTKDGANYKFVMPAGTVEVKATFTAGAAEEDGFTDVKPDAYYYDAVNWAVDTGITNGMSATMFGSNFDCTRAQMVTFLWRAAGCPAPKATECDFVDLVKGSYYYDAVLWAAENGITIGTSATTFSPDDNVTRGQTVTFFWRMENKPTADVNVAFTDVAADAYYYDAVAWAVEEEITNGVSATEFAPNDMCKREQIVTFLYRFFVK